MLWVKAVEQCGFSPVRSSTRSQSLWSYTGSRAACADEFSKTSNTFGICDWRGPFRVIVHLPIKFFDLRGDRARLSTAYLDSIN